MFRVFAADLSDSPAINRKTRRASAGVNSNRSFRNIAGGIPDTFPWCMLCAERGCAGHLPIGSCAIWADVPAFICSRHRLFVGAPLRWRSPLGALQAEIPAGCIGVARRLDRRNGPLVAIWRAEVAYRRLCAGILLCCAKELLFSATGATCWAVGRPGSRIAVHAQCGHSSSRHGAQRCGRDNSVCLCIREGARD